MRSSGSWQGRRREKVEPEFSRKRRDFNGRPTGKSPATTRPVPACRARPWRWRSSRSRVAFQSLVYFASSLSRESYAFKTSCSAFAILASRSMIGSVLCKGPYGSSTNRFNSSNSAEVSDLNDSISSASMGGTTNLPSAIKFDFSNPLTGTKGPRSAYFSIRTK